VYFTVSRSTVCVYWHLVYVLHSLEKLFDCLLVPSLCATQSRESLYLCTVIFVFVIHSLERHYLFTAPCRGIVCVLHSVKVHCDCVLRSFEGHCVCDYWLVLFVLHSVESQCECTAQCRCTVFVLHCLERHSVCTAQCRGACCVYCTV